MDFLIELMGIAGLIVLLIGFVLNIQKQTKKRKIIYNALNFIGATLLCIYAYINSITIFIALEAIWAIIALYFVYSLVRDEPKKKLNHKK